MNSIQDQLASAPTLNDTPNVDRVIGVTLSCADMAPEGIVNRTYVFYKSISPTVDLVRAATVKPGASDSAATTQTPARATFSSPVMSRHHARIGIEDDGSVNVTDLASLHGTYIQANATRALDKLDAHKPRKLQTGDVVLLGKAVYRDDQFWKPVSIRVTLVHANTPAGVGVPGPPASVKEIIDVDRDDTPNRYGMYNEPSSDYHSSEDIDSDSADEEMSSLDSNDHEDLGSSPHTSDVDLPTPAPTPSVASKLCSIFPYTADLARGVPARLPLPSLRDLGFFSPGHSGTEPSPFINTDNNVSVSANDEACVENGADCPGTESHNNAVGIYDGSELDEFFGSPYFSSIPENQLGVPDFSMDKDNSADFSLGMPGALSDPVSSQDTDRDGTTKAPTTTAGSAVLDEGEDEDGLYEQESTNSRSSSPMQISSGSPSRSLSPSHDGSPSLKPRDTINFSEFPSRNASGDRVQARDHGQGCGDAAYTLYRPPSPIPSPSECVYVPGRVYDINHDDDLDLTSGLPRNSLFLPPLSPQHTHVHMHAPPPTFPSPPPRHLPHHPHMHHHCTSPSPEVAEISREAYLSQSKHRFSELQPRACEQNYLRGRFSRFGPSGILGTNLRFGPLSTMRAPLWARRTEPQPPAAQADVIELDSDDEEHVSSSAATAKASDSPDSTSQEQVPAQVSEATELNEAQKDATPQRNERSPSTVSTPSATSIRSELSFSTLSAKIQSLVASEMTNVTSRIADLKESIGGIRPLVERQVAAAAALAGATRSSDEMHLASAAQASAPQDVVRPQSVEIDMASRKELQDIREEMLRFSSIMEQVLAKIEPLRVQAEQAIQVDNQAAQPELVDKEVQSFSKKRKRSEEDSEISLISEGIDFEDRAANRPAKRARTNTASVVKSVGAAAGYVSLGAALTFATFAYVL